jgi:hypothetical protein
VGSLRTGELVVVREAFTKASCLRKKRRLASRPKRPDKETDMRKLAALLVIAVAASVGAVPALAADGPVKQYPQNVTLGFYRGQVISYLDFGPVKLASGNKVAPIWVVTNGVEAQRNIIDTVPGRKDYTPLWAVRMVTWKDGAMPRVLRSRNAVDAAVRAGQATVAAAPVVVNCPVL